MKLLWWQSNRPYLCPIWYNSGFGWLTLYWFGKNIYICVRLYTIVHAISSMPIITIINPELLSAYITFIVTVWVAKTKLMGCLTYFLSLFCMRMWLKNMDIGNQQLLLHDNCKSIHIYLKFSTFNSKYCISCFPKYEAKNKKHLIRLWHSLSSDQHFDYQKLFFFYHQHFTKKVHISNSAIYTESFSAIWMQNKH